jgi:Pentapeptide repeats (8 copies)
MRPIFGSLSVTLLVSSLIAVVVVAGEQEGLEGPPCEGLYKGHTPTPEELETVLRSHQAWLNAGNEPNDERRANLCQANLRWATLRRRTNLRWANLQGANLITADLFGARLVRANLQGADLTGADLRNVNLQEAELGGAYLKGASLQGAVYEPNPEKLPSFWILIDPSNKLETLVFYESPAALMALRKAFKEGRMRTQERQITYAIEHTRRLQAWDPLWYRDDHYRQDTRLWLEQLAGKSKSLFNRVLFELPSGYGMAPGRALLGLLGFIPCFAVLYWFALQRAKSHSGLWMIVPADRIAPGRGKEKIVRIRLHPAKTWWGCLRGESRLFCTSLYFSLLSAFHLGWRELNVGTWISRMQPREYILRATGWVRFFAGLQSLLSVYLLALWVLTYFGRPFE